MLFQHSIKTLIEYLVSLQTSTNKNPTNNIFNCFSFIGVRTCSITQEILECF